jgi:cell wall-associated NlpC family hydrolase
MAAFCTPEFALVLDPNESIELAQPKIFRALVRNVGEILQNSCSSPSGKLPRNLSALPDRVLTFDILRKIGLNARMNQHFSWVTRLAVAVSLYASISACAQLNGSAPSAHQASNAQAPNSVNSSEISKTRRIEEALEQSVSAAGSSLSQILENRSQLVLQALSLLGVNYKFGGNSPETGLDCSGLVRLVYNRTIGAVLPRRAEDISRQSQTIEAQALQPGDLVFFNTLKRAFSHVGIYIGNGQFIHAPSSGGVVRVEDMSKTYWQQRFNGARRIPGAENQ